MRRTTAVPLVLLLAAACSDLPTEPTPEALKPIDADAAVAFASVPGPWAGCQFGQFSSGALWQVCFPADWNGDVVLWGHGYKAPMDPIAISNDAIDGTPVSAIVLGLRFAYATTSYRRNGLVAADASHDLAELSNLVSSMTANVRNRYLVGASEGGLATALALENLPTSFEGGLIACAPTGSFRGQVNYFGDVRVLFDYFFPGVLPGSPVFIDEDLIEHWEDVYEPAVRAQLAGSPSKTAQLIRTGGIAVDPANPASAIESIVDALWYNVFAADDARAVLGGVPFDNRLRWYTGSSNDFLLNLRVRRIRADGAALTAMRAYEASGRLRRPAQAVHTRYDPVTPFWQAQLYQTEALFNSGLTLLSIPSDNYGHCAFDVEEVLASFALLVLRVTGSNLLAIDDVFPDPAAIARFRRLAGDAGASPEVWTRAQVTESLIRAR